MSNLAEPAESAQSQKTAPFQINYSATKQPPIKDTFGQVNNKSLAILSLERADSYLESGACT